MNADYYLKYQNEIGLEDYKALWDACDDLYIEVKMQILTLSKLKDALINSNLATIRRIHAQLQAWESTAKCVPDFLLERYRRNGGVWLLLIIAALHEPIPEPYDRVHLACLGFSRQIPYMIKKVSVGLNASFHHRSHGFLIIAVYWQLEEGAKEPFLALETG